MQTPIRPLEIILQEIEEQKGSFLTVEMFDDLKLPDVFPEIEKRQDDPQARDPKSSFFQKDDPQRIKYLLSWGIDVPTEWYSDGLEFQVNANSQYHAEIVTSMVLIEKLKDIFGLLQKGYTPEQIKSEFDYHTNKIFSHRIDRDGDREPDLTGEFRNREARMKANGLTCNPEGRVTVSELIQIRDMIFSSLKKQTQPR